MAMEFKVPENVLAFLIGIHVFYSTVGLDSDKNIEKGEFLVDVLRGQSVSRFCGL